MLSKFSKMLEIIKQNGGVIRSAWAIFLRDDLKDGYLVGEDEFGNKYYENNRYFFGRNRWVHYADHVFFDYDASQIPPTWHGWMHYKTDLLPSEDESRPNYFWMERHTENLSGTSKQYVPYSTTRPKIIPWKPKSVKVDSKGTDKKNKSTRIFH